MAPTTEFTSAGLVSASGAGEAGQQAAKSSAGRGRLIKQVELLLRESGNSEPFDAAAWVDRWLHRPRALSEHPCRRGLALPPDRCDGGGLLPVMQRR